MKPEPRDRELERIAREASVWIVRCDRGLSAAEEADLDRWREVDPRHQVALARAERVWRRFDAVAAEKERGPWWWRGPLLLGGAGVAAAVALTLGRWLIPWTPEPTSLPGPPRLVSAVPAAEQRRFLADGSVIDLALASRVEAVPVPLERRFQLIEGAAHFAVAHDAARPFVVATEGGVEVRALGTVFSVAVAGGEVAVQVASGRVRVRSGEDGDGEVLEAGERWVASADRTRAPRREPALTAAAPVLPLAYEFERTPLTRVVEELNLRGGPRLIVEDPDLAGMPIYASLRGDRIAAFVRLLEATGEVEAVADGSGWRLRRARASAPRHANVTPAP